MNTEKVAPQPKYLKDYTPPHFSIEKVHLTFKLDDERTRVICLMKMKREVKKTPLVLNGERMKLITVNIDGKELSADQYTVNETHLTIPDVPDQFCISIENEINPKANTSLDGLYKSKDIFCTQNEPHGFRKITYFLDRPDVMTTYTTKVIASKELYPVLLSNGNKIAEGDLPGGKHFVEWNDPHKKPSYLFALVAGDLDCLEDTFMRRSNKPVKLQIFCESAVKDQCHYAMEALKKSMKWDEEVFNLEYDLDIFMIVAVDAFNAGAMENKGLNIFNTSCVLADPKTATDDNFIRVEKVIAHEYFHNWTGDRVTLRDWFQLTLKEGLTVFRDQEFTSDMNSRAVHRIESVHILRSHQFAEDAGPTAHPIRPASYIEMNNFYTTTIYDKGSEIIRMIYTLLGKDLFYQGMKKYFELFDGQAITCDDFVYAMEQASSKDLTQFKRWYEQKGTPHLKVNADYNEAKQTYTLYLEQSNPKEGSKSPPLHFPLQIGLLDSKGNDFPVPEMLEMKEKKQTFHFQNISEKPTLSINRGFSAPILIDSPLTDEELRFLMAKDNDDFNRWEAAQEIALRTMLSHIDQVDHLDSIELDPQYQSAFTTLLTHKNLDLGLKSLALVLPSESALAQKQEVITFDENHQVRNWLKKQLAKQNKNHFLELYHELAQNSSYDLSALSMAQRRLKNCALSYLCHLEEPEMIDYAYNQFLEASNMTDEFAALSLLNQIDCPQRKEALDRFFQKWKDNQLVMVKWLSIQALSPLANALQEVESLTQHQVFDYKIPNLARGLIGSFLENHVHFHAKDGSGYHFFEKQLSHLDKINPQVAARLSSAFRKYPKLDATRRQMMEKVLQNLLNNKDLSRNTYEIVSKSIGSVSQP